MTARISLGCLVCCVFVLDAVAQAPLTILGITDRTVYTDRATFSVPALPGYSYFVQLDGIKVPAETTNVVTRADYHEVFVARTNTATLETTNRLVRFIVQTSRRGDPERGLIEWLPYPLTPSSANEFAGAQLRITAPQNYPRGFPIPVIAWVSDAAGNEVRANGFVKAPGFESSPIKILRGVGSGFLPPATSAGTIDYNARLQDLEDSRQIEIEASTTWVPISGLLAGSTFWPENARIQITGNLTIPDDSTLTIGAGTVVRLNPLVNITNSGRVLIHGTAEQPVVFTSTNIVVPENNAGAWGGFLMRGSAAELVANHTIMTGGGGATSFSFSPGASHRSEQAVFLAHSGARVSMTNCYIINTHGQVGNGYQARINVDHCLFQRAITAGEYDTCTNIFNHSALIEFPADNGVVSASIADADFDGIYFVRGTNLFTNTLVGFCKDDAIDAGSGAAGSVRLEKSWIEGALHEGLAWSGSGRRTWTIDTVIMNSGQGIEAGWSSSNPNDGALATPSPDVFANRIFATANSVGARFGDNYPWGFKGFLRITNSLILYNYRDVFAKTWNNPGQSWDTNSWVDRLGQMDLRSNFLTAADARFPFNSAWDPEVDGTRVAHWMSTPPEAPVGIGFAVWTNQFNVNSIFDGIPVRLSSFTTNFVSVDYEFNDGISARASGTLTFAPGETLKRIHPAGFELRNQSQLFVRLKDPVNGELTGQTNVIFNGTAPLTFISAAVIGSQRDIARIGEGIPVAMTVPAAHEIGFEYAFESSSGPLVSGTGVFAPGETLVWLHAPGLDPAAHSLLRLTLRFGHGADASLVGATNIYFVQTPPVDVAAPTTFIGRSTGPWKYLDTGVNAGTAWRNIEYDETGWATGVAQLGYGENDQATTIGYGPDANNKYITTYFRRTFTVDDPSVFADLSMWLLRDDGGLVFLNGTEVFRTPNMPPAPAGIDYLTPTTATGENTIDTATLSASLLVAGTNVIAVEIHQERGNSSDLSFDFELIGNALPISAAAPRIFLGTFDRDLTIAWSVAGFVVEEADSVIGPWTPVTATSPLVISPTAPQKFYRLKR